MVAFHHFEKTVIVSFDNLDKIVWKFIWKPMEPSSCFWVRCLELNKIHDIQYTKRHDDAHIEVKLSVAEKLQVHEKHFIFSWSHTFFSRKTSLFSHCPGSRFLGIHHGLFLRWCTPCSSRRPTPPVPRRLRNDLGKTHSCTHRISAPMYKDARRSRRWRICRRTSHIAAQWPLLAASCRKSNRDDALPWSRNLLMRGRLQSVSIWNVKQ